MVLWHNSPHSNLHIGFHENNAFVFSFTNTGWDTPNGLQTPNNYADDLNVWVHWGGTYDLATGERIIYRNGISVAADTFAAGAGYQGGNADLHISSGSIANPSWTNGPFQGSLDDIYVLKRKLSVPEIAFLVRDRQLVLQTSLVLYFNFEQASITNPQEATSGPNVTDLSGSRNNAILYGDWNRTKPRLSEDSVPVDVTCVTSQHGSSDSLCKTTLDYFKTGFCVDTIGNDVTTQQTKLSDISLPADYTYPAPPNDPALSQIKEVCTRMCTNRVTEAATGCELIVTATTAQCWGHASPNVERNNVNHMFGSHQYCWTAQTLLTDVMLPPVGQGGGRAGVDALEGPGGWTNGFARLSPSCFPHYFDDRTFQCLFRSICGSDYDTLASSP